MSRSNNWSIVDGPGLAITSTSAGVRTALTGRESHEDILIDNQSAVDVFVAAGDATVVALAATGVRVPAGTIQPFRKTGATHLYAISPGGNAGIVVHTGNGT